MLLFRCHRRTQPRPLPAGSDLPARIVGTAIRPAALVPVLALALMLALMLTLMLMLSQRAAAQTPEPAAAAAVASAASAGTSAAGKAALPGVLVLMSTGYGQPGIDSYVDGLYAVLRERGLRFDRVHIEYLDLVKHPDAGYRAELAALMLRKYRDKPLGVVVTLQPLALDFLLKDAIGLAPSAAVMVAQARAPAAGAAVGRELHLQTPTLAFAGTLERALELFPNTRRVFVLAGSSALEQERLREARRQFEPWAGRLSFEYLDALSFAAIEQRLAAAPAGSVVIAPGVNRDAAGQVMSPVDSIVRIARTANAPVFPVYAGSMGQGPIGGMVSMLESEGRSMAASVFDFLSLDDGGRAGFTVQSPAPVPLFDWRALQRWGGDWSRLPAETVYLHRPPSLWGQYKGYVVGAAAALLMLSVLVLALTVQNRRRRRAELSLRASQTRYRLLADNMSDVLWVLNLEHQRWEFISPSIEQLTGYSPDDFMRLGFDEVLAPNSYSAFEASSGARVREQLQSPDEAHRYVDVLELNRRNGPPVWTESVTHYIRNEAGELVLTGVTRDISQRLHAQQEIRRLAFFDALTQLPNRKLLQDRAQQAQAASARSRRHGALLFIDLDHFKTLNDTRGHDVGDLLLQQVAQRLRGCVRAADTVARLGGDEFVVLLEDLDEDQSRAAGEAKLVGDQVLAAFGSAFELQGQEHHVTASIGIALYLGEADSYEELLKRADLAMYRAKAAGREGLAFFDPQMQAIVLARAALEADLRRALQAGEFVLHYQPQVDVAGRIIGAEALVRWHRPGHGLASPAEFIPLAEESGLIRPLGRWVLESACARLVSWAGAAATRELVLAVNVSPRQFRHADFVDSVLDTLARSGADARRLKLELTENLMLDDVESTIAKMNQLREHGVSFSLDDFGTGYSSLAYLKRLPLEQLKIDRSFVNDVLSDANDASIARTVLALGHSLGLSVVAEGVETEGQRRFLAEQGCDGFQGYLFSRPLPGDEFLALIASQGMSRA